MQAAKQAFNAVFGNALLADEDDVDTGGVEFWREPERQGWLQKQGDHIKTWRRRWFVLKGGRIFWFKSDAVTADSVPRGAIDMSKCLSVRGAEDALNKRNAFEIAGNATAMYFVADTEKEKEDWINSIGRAIVRHSGSLQDEEVLSY